MKNFVLLLLVVFVSSFAQAQNGVDITGTAGLTYDGYGLDAKPDGYNYIRARRPYNMLRFMFQPTLSFGDFKIPVNFNFSPMRTNFASTPFGMFNVPGFPKQTFGQWITNPMNNMGINPSYKWAELQLGTQYQKYSDLSTGDIGAFGYGVSLKPGKFRFKFFKGVSQQAFQPFSTVVPTAINFGGNYKRSITMAQIGLEKEDLYFAGFNIVKGKDEQSSIIAPTTTTPNPADNFIVSFASKFKTKKGWYGNAEMGTTFFTKNLNDPYSTTLLQDNQPFIKSHTSTYRDHAMQFAFGKKSKDLDLGASMKWLGAGYNTMGYPFVQNDRLEYLLNTRFNALKRKINVVASVGQRFGNWSSGNARTKQLLANINFFAQVNDHFNLNVNYNNFGFQTPSTGAVAGIRNVGNDLSINPTYTWTTEKLSHLLSFTYNWSNYTETIFLGTPPVSTNNTNTALLLYVPTFLSKPNFNTDVSVMYFRNQNSFPTTLNMYTASVSAGFKLPKYKVDVRTQLQYNITKVDTFSPSNNIMLILGADWQVTKKLTFKTNISTNVFKYGNELSPQPQLLGAHYLETMYRAALLYRFGK